jgi:hypothetical protein
MPPGNLTQKQAAKKAARLLVEDMETLSPRRAAAMMTALRGLAFKTPAPKHR